MLLSLKKFEKSQYEPISLSSHRTTVHEFSFQSLFHCEPFNKTPDRNSPPRLPKLTPGEISGYTNYLKFRENKILVPT